MLERPGASHYLMVMRLQHLAIVGLFLSVCGCATRRSIDLQSLRGPISEVVAANRLEQYHSWPIMNLPAGDEGGTRYFLESGDLIIHYSGRPRTVQSAEFWPSPKSAEERFKAANAGWDDWVKAHTNSEARK